MSRHSPWCQAVWGSGARRGCACPRSGRVGLTASRPSTNVTLWWQMCWSASWRVIHALHVCVPLPKPLGLCMASWGGARLRGLPSGTEPDLRHDSLRSTSQGALSTKQLPGLTSVLTDSGQALAISGRTWCWPCAVHLSHVSHHEDRPSAV